MARKASVATVNGARPVSIEIKVRLEVLALPEKEGGYSVLIPALGCSTEGETIEEAEANAVDAAEGWLASQHEIRKDELIRTARGE